MRLIALLLLVLCAALAGPAAAQDYRIVLRFTTLTGSDDLRGGGDNVYAVVDLAGRETRHLLNQRAMRWPDRTRHVTDVPLPSNFRIEDLRAIRLETTFRGGVDGDNWNMDSILVQVAPAVGDQTPLVVARHGPFRFTGDRRSLRLRINPERARGRDDLIRR